MEERSSKRPQPSGDWKPYSREEPQASGESSEGAGSSGDWKPYERETARGQDSRDAPESARHAEANQEARSGQDRDARDSEEQTRDESASEADAREERDSEHEPSTVDAMGHEKHRKVIGQRYGASRGRQFLYYGIFVAFIIGAYIGLKAATDSLDKAPANDPDQAPWSKPNAPPGPLGGFEPETPGQSGSTDFQ